MNKSKIKKIWYKHYFCEHNIRAQYYYVVRALRLL